MKKFILTLTVAGLIVAITSLGKTEEMKGGMMMDKGMMGKKMMGGMMMHEMMEKKVVATSDGGIIVVTGSKLLKYDKDLNLIKEVEIKSDNQEMQNMMKMCPMMGKGMMGKEDGKEAPAGDDAQEQAEHESHHPEK